MTPNPEHPVARTLSALRTALLAILVLGAVGTGVELLLLGHTDGAWQWFPIVLTGLSLVFLAWHGVDRGPRSIRAIQALMVVFILSGMVGVLLHYQGNVEFEREMAPTIGGLKLFTEAMTGATPALAPGTMLQLGLVGLAWSYRHPALTRTLHT